MKVCGQILVLKKFGKTINEQKVLGVSIDCSFKFSHYILENCKKLGRKLSALTRICKFINLECRRVLMKLFLAYCPLYGCAVVKHLIIV